MKSPASALSLLCLVMVVVSSCGSPVPTQTALSAAPSPVIIPTTPASPTAPKPSPAVPTLTLSPQPAEPWLCKGDSPDVYLVFAQERHHIVDWETFLNLGYKQDQIRPCGATAELPEGAPLTRWLKGSSVPVYWLKDGQRHHIPDMETFHALGFLEQDIAMVPDELLALWPLGAPLPPQRDGSPTSPAALPVTASASATPAAAALREALKAIHDQFQIDPSRGCFELVSPYPEYHQGLQRMTALLVADPRSQALSLAEREALFAEVTGFDGVRFFEGDGGATLVSLRTNRGHNLACSSHYASPDALHVVDRQGAIYDLGAGGTDTQVWWVASRWVVLFRTKLDSSSGPTPWVVWHIGQSAGRWQRAVEFSFAPTPYDFNPPPLRFENGYQTMVADLQYWWADDPCEFSAAFKAAYKHDTWQMRRTYQLAGDTYQLVSSQVLTFTVLRQDTGQAEAINWQAWCAGPIR